MVVTLSVTEHNTLPMLPTSLFFLSHHPGAGPSMALDPQPGGLEAVDRITVKIADLVNGERLFSITAPTFVLILFQWMLQAT